MVGPHRVSQDFRARRGAHLAGADPGRRRLRRHLFLRPNRRCARRPLRIGDVGKNSQDRARLGRVLLRVALRPARRGGRAPRGRWAWARRHDPRLWDRSDQSDILRVRLRALRPVRAPVGDHAPDHWLGGDCGHPQRRRGRDGVPATRRAHAADAPPPRALRDAVPPLRSRVRDVRRLLRGPRSGAQRGHSRVARTPYPRVAPAARALRGGSAVRRATLSSTRSASTSDRARASTG
jgi:hypothetical protein